MWRIKTITVSLRRNSMSDKACIESWFKCIHFTYACIHVSMSDHHNCMSIHIFDPSVWCLQGYHEILIIKKCTLPPIRLYYSSRFFFPQPKKVKLSTSYPQIAFLYFQQHEFAKKRFFIFSKGFPRVFLFLPSIYIHSPFAVHLLQTSLFLSEFTQFVKTIQADTRVMPVRNTRVMLVTNLPRHGKPISILLVVAFQKEDLIFLFDQFELGMFLISSTIGKYISLKSC